MEYDWRALFPSLGRLNEEHGTNFKEAGWYTSNGDTCLVYPTGDKWWIYVWQGQDPRPTLRGFLELPEFAQP